MVSDDTAAEAAVIEQLEEAYYDELETVMNYLANSVVLDTITGEIVAEHLAKDVEEELNHARDIAERLKELDSSPPGSAEFEPRQESLQPPEDNTDAASVVAGVIDAEEDAIEGYRNLIDAAVEANDPVTEDLAVQLLADEEAHREEFRSLARDL